MKLNQTAPTNPEIMRHYGAKIRTLAILASLAQAVSFGTEFAPIKYALEDAFKFFAPAYAGILSAIIALVAALVIETMVRFGTSTGARGVLYKHYKGLPIPADDPDESAKEAGKLARFVWALGLIMGVTGVALSTLASYQGGKDIAQKYAPSPARPALDLSRDSALITASSAAFRQDSAAIAAAGADEVKAYERAARAVPVNQPTKRAELKAAAAAAKQRTSAALVDRSGVFRAETSEAQGRITAAIAAADETHRAAVEAAKNKAAGYGLGLAWLTIALQIVSIFSLCFIESTKKAAGIEPVVNYSTFDFHDGILGEAYDAIRERFEANARARINRFRENTVLPEVTLKGDVVDAAQTGQKIIPLSRAVDDVAEPAIAATAERRRIGFDFPAPEAYGKGEKDGSANVSELKPIDHRPDPKPGFYAVYPGGQIQHAPTLPAGVWGSYPSDLESKPAVLKYHGHGKNCRNCGALFKSSVSWQIHCSTECRTQFNNLGRKNRKR